MSAKPCLVFSGNIIWAMLNFRLGIMKSFVGKGYDVYFLAANDDYESSFENSGVKFIAVNNLKRKGLNPIKELQLLREYYQIYKKLDPSFIFHYTIKPNIYGTIAAKRLGIPSIAITTGLGFVFTHDGFVTSLVKKLYRYAFKGALEVWFLNEEDQKSFIDNKIIDLDKAFILPGEGVNLKHFSPRENKLTDANAPSKIKLLFAARLLWDKGIGVLVEAIDILQKQGLYFDVDVVGLLDPNNPSGVKEEQLLEWEEKGLINYLKSTNDVRPFIAASDAVVLPTYYREGVPRILLEAASMSKPIITTDNVGCRDVVIHGSNGYLCKLNDADDLAEKLIQFSELSTVDMMAMGAKGRSRVVEMFSEEKIFNIYQDKLKRYSHE